MLAFLTISFVVFFIFSKFYTIAKKKDVIRGTDKHSAFVFAAFMWICTALWFAFKYAFKSTVIALVCFICWPNIKQFLKEIDEKAAAEIKSVNHN